MVLELLSCIILLIVGGEAYVVKLMNNETNTLLSELDFKDSLYFIFY